MVHLHKQARNATDMRAKHTYFITDWYMPKAETIAAGSAQKITGSQFDEAVKTDKAVVGKNEPPAKKKEEKKTPEDYANVKNGPIWFG